MKLFNKSLLLLTFSFGAFFTSCEKDETAQDINNQEALVDNNLDEVTLESISSNEVTIAGGITVPTLGDGLPNNEWLNAQEGTNLGHTIDKHWNKSDRFLEGRTDSDSPSSFQTDTSEGYAQQSIVINQIRTAASSAITNAIKLGVNWHTYKFKAGGGYNLGNGYNSSGRYKDNLKNITITVAYSISLAAWYVVTAYPNFT